MKKLFFAIKTSLKIAVVSQEMLSAVLFRDISLNKKCAGAQPSGRLRHLYLIGIA
jgi:hypothetical protein